MQPMIAPALRPDTRSGVSRQVAGSAAPSTKPGVSGPRRRATRAYLAAWRGAIRQGESTRAARFRHRATLAHEELTWQDAQWQ